MTPEETQKRIAEVCDSIKELLISKNKKYGSSATNPLRILSKQSAVEQLYVRIDDKLSRIKNTGISGPDEDTLQDLIGYLILLKVALAEAALPVIPEPTPEDLTKAAASWTYEGSGYSNVGTLTDNVTYTVTVGTCTPFTPCCSTCAGTDGIKK
jgi:hypothetical protein